MKQVLHVGYIAYVRCVFQCVYSVVWIIDVTLHSILQLLVADVPGSREECVENRRKPIVKAGYKLV